MFCLVVERLLCLEEGGWGGCIPCYIVSLEGACLKDQDHVGHKEGAFSEFQDWREGF